MRIRAKAAQAGVVGGGSNHYRFTVLGDGLLRMEWAPDCTFEDRPSAFAVCRNEAKSPEFKVEESHDRLEIITSRFHLTYNKQEFAAYGLYALVFGFTRSLWRFKEDGQTNLGGTYRTLDNYDGRINRENGKPMPLEEGVLSQKGYALLDDSNSMLFSNDGFVASRRHGPGRVDCYLFAYGHDYREAIKALYSISESPPLLPRWALGNWWSRYYKYTTDSYLALMDRFREEGIPLSVAVIDMDWHLVDDPKVIEAGQTGWTGYTWNKQLFPDPPKFLAGLHRRSLKVTLNDHPADGIHSYEDVYEEVANAMGVDTSSGSPIPFDAVNRDYLKAYFEIVLASLEKDGCDFWWIDWQQGPFSLLKGVDPLWVLNHFHFQRNKKITAGSEPIIFSRYGGPGSHRYPVGFSGDTCTTWASLDFQPQFTAMASNIGYGWWSHDIGGHMLGIKDYELTIRWVQFGVFSPIMRLHSTKNRWVTKEPWQMPSQPRDIVTSLLRLRHRLIPYLQTMNYRVSFDGEPLVQPMYWSHPKQDDAYKVPNQYFFGSEMIVIPITTPQDKSLGLGKVKGWLPRGTYVDLFTGLTYTGGREMWFSRTLDHIPVLLPAGSVVPLDGELEPANGGTKPDAFEIIVAPGEDGSFVMLEEPRHKTNATENSTSQQQRDWDQFQISYTHGRGSLHIKPARVWGRSQETQCSWSVRILGIEKPANVRATRNGIEIRPKVREEPNGVLIQLGMNPIMEPLLIELGSAPTIRRKLPMELIEEIIQNAQIEYDVKDKLWAILGDESLSAAARLVRLQTLETSENLRVVLTEYLSALLE